MDNREVSLEISEKNAREYYITTCMDNCSNSEYASSNEECYLSAMKMAQLKDDQFKEYIKSKFSKCKNNTANVPLKAILFEEIIKEILNIEL